MSAKERYDHLHNLHTRTVTRRAIHSMLFILFTLKGLDSRQGWIRGGY